VHRVPWISILTAPCVWAIIITHGASVFGFFTVVNQLPTYMKHILRFNIKEVSCWLRLQPVVYSFVDISLPVSSFL
jgi:ACS family sodium-dependent inorganic phosphate cotransporter